MKASGLSTTTPGNKKGKKPPVGLDTHQLSKRTAGAAGVGKRGQDTKARGYAGVPMGMLCGVVG